MITDPAQSRPKAIRERISNRLAAEIESGTTSAEEGVRWFYYLLRVEGMTPGGNPADLDLDPITVNELHVKSWLCRVSPHDGSFKVEIVAEDGFEPVATAIHDDQHAAAVAALARARNIESPE